MAGLCLCTTDLPEIAAIIRQYELGVTVPVLDGSSIAWAINGLDRDRIDACKLNAHCRPRAKALLGAQIRPPGGKRYGKAIVPQHPAESAAACPWGKGVTT